MRARGRSRARRAAWAWWSWYITGAVPGAGAAAPPGGGAREGSMTATGGCRTRATRETTAGPIGKRSSWTDRPQPDPGADRGKGEYPLAVAPEEAPGPRRGDRRALRTRAATPTSATPV